MHTNYNQINSETTDSDVYASQTIHTAPTYDTYERSIVTRNLGAWLSEREKCYTGAVCNAYCGILDEKCALTENQLQHPHSTLLAHTSNGATGRHYNEIPMANADHERNTPLMESSDLSTNQLQLTSDPQHRHLVQPAWQRSTTPGGQTAFVTTLMPLGNADMALGMKDTITNARKTSEAMEARCAILLCCVVLPCSGRLLWVWTNVRRHPWICRFLTSLTSSY